MTAERERFRELALQAMTKLLDHHLSMGALEPGIVPTLLLVAFLLPILRGNPWGYGWERPSTTMMLDINPVQTPAGIKTVQTEELALDGHEFKHEGLAHSAIYLDPRVHQKILQWITATARV
jgi:hypothetical protein